MLKLFAAACVTHILHTVYTTTHVRVYVRMHVHMHTYICTLKVSTACMRLPLPSLERCFNTRNSTFHRLNAFTYFVYIYSPLYSVSTAMIESHASMAWYTLRILNTTLSQPRRAYYVKKVFIASFYKYVVFSVDELKHNWPNLN